MQKVYDRWDFMVESGVGSRVIMMSFVVDSKFQMIPFTLRGSQTDCILLTRSACQRVIALPSDSCHSRIIDEVVLPQ